MSIKIIKDQAGTTAKVEGIDVNPIPLNSYTCGISAGNGGITIFNPNAPNEQGNPTKIFNNVLYTNFVKSDGSTPVSAEDLKADIDLQLAQPATSEDSGYRGLWNPDTNTPDISNLDPEPEVGDFFFASQSGNYNGIDYGINDRIQYDGVTWNRIPAPDPWEYIQADNSYDITFLNNKNFVDYTLTSNKDITLPSLTTSDAGWLCTVVNSSNSRLNILSTTSGNRQLRRGGSIQLLFNGDGFVVLGYARSGGILSLEDFQNAAVNHKNTVYVDSETIVDIEDMDGSVLFPYSDIVTAISNSNSGDTIMIDGENIITSEIVLPHSLNFLGKNKAEIKYANYDSTNGNIFSFTGSNIEEFNFEHIDFKNSGGYGLLIKKTEEVSIRNCEFYNCGWNGTQLNTILDSSSSGLLGYDSDSVDLQNFYSGAHASNGGAVRIEECRKPLLRESRAEGCLRAFRFQDCGINGGGFLIENQAIGNIESGFYLAAGSLGGCQNITVAINYSAYNANNGLLCVGGINNKFSQNEIYGNWNAGLCGWGSANLTLRDCGLYDNNRSQYNGIGNSGDAEASIQINDAYSFLATSFSLNENARFLAEILDTQVHYTGLGSNTKKVGFFMSEGMGDIPDNDKNIIKIDDVGFIGQDYAIDLSEVDTTNLRISLGDNSYQTIGEKAVREPLVGYYYELPFSNHSMKLNEVDLSITNTGNIIIKEGVGGSTTNPYSVNELQALAHGSEIKVILKGSKKIQFIVPVGGCSIDGSMVNSVLSQAIVQLNDLFTNTSGFASGGNPVTNISLTGDVSTTLLLVLTLQDGTSYSVDITTLGVDENKFVSSGQLNGSNLELTMSDSSIVTIDATNMINGSTLPAISNNWFISYGGSAGNEIESAGIVATYEDKQPFYNGDFLNKGEEYVWTHDDNGYYVLGIYSGAEETSNEVEITYSSKWLNLFRFTTNVTNKVSETSSGVDVASRYASGYDITNNTVLALSYGNDNYLKLYDISNGNRILIGQSNTALVGDHQIISFGGENQPNAKFPVMIKRYSDWTIVHDFDNSETGINDGVEADTVIRSNISISPGEKFLVNFNYFGRSESIGLSYAGPSSGLNNAYTNIGSRLFYNSAELLRAVSNEAVGGDWTWNTSAIYHYDPNGDGSNVGYWNNVGIGNLGLISFRYQLNNVMEIWHETNGEKIATLAVNPDGSDINIYVGFNEAHPYNRIPEVSKQQLDQGSQPVTTFAPDISDQSFDITEGSAFNVQIALDANSDIVNQYVEHDSPTWAVLNQATGVFNGTAPSYNGSSDSYVIQCSAANAKGGSIEFAITLNVQEITYTNTKSLFFEDGVSSYLGGNAALITSLERSGNGSGSADAYSFSLWWKGSTSNSGQTVMYFGANDVANNGYIELRQTNHNGLKRLRLRYGSNNNYLQWTTPSGSITPGIWQNILVTYNGNETGTSSGSMSTYYATHSIAIDGVVQTTSNTHSNYGYSGSIVGQNYRFGRFSSGTYAKDMTYNQMAIWDSDQSANISDIYNSGSTQDLSLLTDQPNHYYEIEDSTTTIQDLIGNAHLVGYNFNSSDLVNDAP